MPALTLHFTFSTQDIGEDMKKLTGILMVLTMMNLFSTEQAHSQSKERSETPPDKTWKLEDLYSSDADWEKAKQELQTQLVDIAKFKGTLSQSSDNLANCLLLSSKMQKTLGRLYSYAQMKSDQDTRDSKYLAFSQQMDQVTTDFSSTSSFIEPEILAIPQSKLKDFLSENKKLSDYDFYLMDLSRRQEHLLSDKEEKILAEAQLMQGGPQTIYSIFTNAEYEYPEVTLSAGEKVKIDKAGYGRLRASSNRADRKIVFSNFFGSLKKFENTFGAQLYSNVKGNMFTARARGFGSSIQSSLFRNNIPLDVYKSLITNVNNNLDTFHRYLKLRQRMLGVDQLEFSDVYAPVVKGVDLNFTLDEANKMILAAFAPLGKEYVNIVEKAMTERWIDYYPNSGKRSGAYSNGSAYDVHPYILLNYNGLYEDVSTLAHELGHTMQSYLSNKTQSFPKADYPIFVAEVASTFNEMLLIDEQLASIKDDDVRLSLLMNYLDRVKVTLFRQTRFAEFELKIHELAESGEALTGELLSKVYGEMGRRYYGHDKKVCLYDEKYDIEWAYIPHFYYNFYVYQYATSFTASTALAEKVLKGEQGALEKYLQFLSAGGSDYPIELLKKAGVDMTTADPFEKTMDRMNKTMDEIEKILAAKGI